MSGFTADRSNPRADAFHRVTVVKRGLRQNFTCSSRYRERASVRITYADKDRTAITD